MSRLSKISIRDSRIEIEQDSNAEVYHVRDFHALTQAAGYVKYMTSQEMKGTFYRGQSRIYASFSPSLYRGVENISARKNRETSLNRTIKDLQTKSKTISNLPLFVVEPLLQHYGIRTTWIDLVDNMWVALWFACHNALTAGKNDQFLNFEKRILRKESPERQYAYIVLVSVEMPTTELKSPGLWIGENTEYVDLRMAAPSTFLRPHAQHGTLFRGKAGKDKRDPDYSKFISGIIRIDLSDALEWLGEGKLLDTHSLFPPPKYDEGYRDIIEDWQKINNEEKYDIGSIQYVGT